MPGCCCSPFECAANQQFNQKKVAQELRRYRQKGPGPTTRLLVDGIVQSAPISDTAPISGRCRRLDLHALGAWCLKRHRSRRIGCIRQGGADEASQRGRADAFGLSMLISLRRPPSSLGDHRYARSRRCAYLLCTELLEAAVAHTERCLALSYPREAWYVRAAMGLENGQRRLLRNPFRTFVHPRAMIGSIISRAGFRLASRRESWVWSADVYVRG